MNVFKVVPESEGASADLLAHRDEAPDQKGGLFLGDDPLPAKHLRVGDTAGDVVHRQTPVIGDRSRIALNGLRHGLAEPGPCRLNQSTSGIAEKGGELTPISVMITK